GCDSSCYGFIVVAQSLRYSAENEQPFRVRRICGSELLRQFDDDVRAGGLAGFDDRAACDRCSVHLVPILSADRPIVPVVSVSHIPARTRKGRPVPRISGQQFAALVTQRARAAASLTTSFASSNAGSMSGRGLSSAVNASGISAQAETMTSAPCSHSLSVTFPSAWVSSARSAFPLTA